MTKGGQMYFTIYILLDAECQMTKDSHTQHCSTKNVTICSRMAARRQIRRDGSMLQQRRIRMDLMEKKLI